ncbi:hypothetical protein FOZ61_008962 [Perkinsus olseni]|uniref:Uncharacterized protein n=1 Tax=Perkinsus olseni TaxID=32597 RepID=A0A7J6M663_PEROL|nr:hypothetical protein FOZ61_008962 [Perkinsus olseni]KAF4668675.1 hypothetical protein FOL46_001852 [Perkinsus olseni]
MTVSASGRHQIAFMVADQLGKTNHVVVTVSLLAEVFHKYLYLGVMPATHLLTLSQLMALVTVNGMRADRWPNAKYTQAIIIGVDGLGGNYFTNASDDQAPHLWEMLNSDRSCFNHLARTVYPPSTLPTWASTLTGMTPAETGIVNDDWYRYYLNPAFLTDTGTPPISGRKKRPLPTIFSIAKEFDEDIRTAYFVSSPVLSELGEDAQDVVGTADDETISRSLIALLESNDFPHLSFIQLSGLAIAGRATYYGSDEYYQALKRIDGIIGEI